MIAPSYRFHEGLEYETNLFEHVGKIQEFHGLEPQSPMFYIPHCQTHLEDLCSQKASGFGDQ